MNYKELNIIGKIWYFILLPLVLLFVIAVAIIIATFAAIIKISNIIGLLDAFLVWTSVIASELTKKSKNAKTKKNNK